MDLDIECAPVERISKRVSVFWPEEDEWFDGVVQEYDEAKGYYVVYDDGDERWEPLDQPMRVEGEPETNRVTEDALPLSTRNDGNDGGSHDGPEMIEPPASPGSEYDDADYADDYQDKEHTEEPLTESSPRKNELLNDPHEGSEDDSEEEEPANEPGSQPSSSQHNAGKDDCQETKSIGQRYEDDTEDEESSNEESVPNHHALSEAKENNNETSDEEQSMTASELPQTYGKHKNIPMMPKSSTPSVPIPIKGILSGRVLRAWRLRTTREHEPNAFVKASFVEAGSKANISLMLRCKKPLLTTATVTSCADPVWTSDLSSDEDEDPQSHRSRAESFRLQLVAPIVPLENTPAWNQLQGDLLFTAYSSSSSGGSGCRGGNEHIGQAVVSLQSLVQELLTSSLTTTLYLELQPRTSKPSRNTGHSSNNLFDEGDVESPELVVSFRFRPIFERAARPSKKRSPSCTSTASRLGHRATIANPTSRGKPREYKDPGAPVAPSKIPAHTSSSQINRKRFEKKIESENRAFAKQLEWKEARRTRQNAELKAQEKRKVTPSQHGARRFDHKASSQINRSKFVQQVSQENKSLGKRLQRILGAETSAQKPGNFCCWAAAESKGSSNSDYMDRDKAYVLDQRLQRQIELDCTMEKAQCKYQQQNQTVEEVVALQEDVATLKSQVEALTKSATRLEILNKKDQHVRDCLLHAAATLGSKPSPRESSRRPPPSTRRSRIKSKSNNDSCGEDAGKLSAGKGRKEQEYELLTQHRDSLQAEIHRQSQELQSLSQQEDELDKELQEKQAQWEFAQATQAFHRQMEKKNAVQVQKALREMERRRRAMEFSHEEEEQWTLYEAHQELKQLQITCQVLQNQHEGKSRSLSVNTQATACEHLSKKIDKYKAKIARLQDDVQQRQRDYEALLVHGGHEKLRKHVQELQRLVFLCQTQATHVRHAERVAQHKGEQLEWAFQRRLFQEQTETEVVLKKRSIARSEQQ